MIEAEIGKIEARLKAAGATVADMCREAEMARSTWQRWSRGATQPNLATWGGVLAATERLEKIAESKKEEDAATP